MHKPGCELPAALAGTAGHVLMRFTVNMAGKVSLAEVAYASVDPPERKKALEEMVTACVREWTFEPPNPDMASWTHGSLEVFQGFHYFHPPAAGGRTVELEDHHRVPAVNIDEMREAKLEFGAVLLKGPDDVAVEGQGWRLLTNLKKQDREAYLEAIRQGITSFDEVFPDAPPVPEGQDLTIMLFRSQDEFNRIAAFDNVFRGPKPAGSYDQHQRTAYTFGSSGSYNHPQRLAIQALVHEVTHHEIQQRLAGGVRDAPYWVHEGIATFVQLLRPPDKKKGLQLARFVRGRQAEGTFRWVSESDRFLDTYIRRAKEGSLPDMGRFLEGQFEPTDAETAYGLSWVLVHFLLNAEDGRLAKPFTAWMMGPMGTADDPGVLSAVSLSVEELQQKLTAHVDSMKHGS